MSEYWFYYCFLLIPIVKNTKLKNILQHLWLFFTTGKCKRVMHISQRESNKQLLLYLGWQKVTCSISNVRDLTCQPLLKIMSRCFGFFFLSLCSTVLMSIFNRRDICPNIKSCWKKSLRRTCKRPELIWKNHLKPLLNSQM